MIALDKPSLMQAQQPNWKGFTDYIYGTAAHAWEATTNVFTAPWDPVLKSTAAVQEATAKAIDQGANALESVGTGAIEVAHGLSTGLKWAVFIVALLLFVYVLSVASPFLPKPRSA